MPLESRAWQCKTWAQDGAGGTREREKELKEDLKCTDVDDDDWDISSLEEDRSIGRKAGREQKEPPPPVKNESNSTQVPNAWVAANPKGPKGEGPQDESSTLKSSLVTVTEWSDSSDV